MDIVLPDRDKNQSQHLAWAIFIFFLLTLSVIVALGLVLAELWLGEPAEKIQGIFQALHLIWLLCFVSILTLNVFLRVPSLCIFWSHKVQIKQ